MVTVFRGHGKMLQRQSDSKPLLLSVENLCSQIFLISFLLQVNLYSPSRLVYVPCQILLMKICTHDKQKTLSFRVLYLPLGVCVSRFPFLFFKQQCEFPHRLLNRRIQGLSAKNDSDAHPVTYKSLSRGEWVNQMEIPRQTGVLYPGCTLELQESF